MSKVHVGSRLLEIMENKNLTRKDLADIFDVGIRQIDNYINGTSNLPIENAFKLVREYNLSLDYIYEVSKSPTNSKNTWPKQLSEQISIEHRERVTDIDHVRARLIELFSLCDSEGKNLVVRIPLDIYDYIHKVDKIRIQNKLPRKRDDLISGLKTIFDKKCDFNVVFRIPLEYGIPFFDSGNGECIFGFDYVESTKSATPEELEYAQAFFSLLEKQRIND